MGYHFEQTLVMDTKPIPVVGYRRSKRQSDFAGSASYGYCASRKMKYTDEREAAEAVLYDVSGRTILADKGFIGEDWQAEVSRTTDNRVFTTKRENQHLQNPRQFDRLLNHFRQRIEGVFNEVQNTGRNLERLLRKTTSGLFTHEAANMASHTLKFLLHHRFGIDVLTFEQVTAIAY